MLNRNSSAGTAANSSTQLKLQCPAPITPSPVLAADYVELPGEYRLTNKGFILNVAYNQHFLKIDNDFDYKILLANVGKFFKIRLYADFGEFYENDRCVGKLMLNEPIPVSRSKP